MLFVFIRYVRMFQSLKGILVNFNLAEVFGEQFVSGFNPSKGFW
ncbi:hypothetical protein CKA32_001414 [Geitlerinema sp. FC II]|nr:hypothetical protein CKA32_001414 [Geitlerinema sp. FC II]